MVQATHAALSAIDKAKPVTKDDVLRMIPQFEVPPVFLRRHLKEREVVIGTIGDRGGGKSGSDATLVTTDCFFIGKQVYSNMIIKVSINVDDITAAKYGLRSGGVAKYESKTLEKDALLKLDERYMNAALLIEEINVGYSNVRRIMSNTNVDFNETCQQLRKFKCPLYYNVINEMFIDSQLRAMTDIFIKTYDTAFDVDSLEVEKPMGVDFSWMVYPMSGYMMGQQGRYDITHKAIGPVRFHFKPWRGIYSTDKYQKQGIYTMSSKDKNKMLMAVESSPDNVQVFSEFGYLEDFALSLREKGIHLLQGWEISQLLGQQLTDRLKMALRAYGIHYDARANAYKIESFKLSEGQRHSRPHSTNNI
jgi:hypothetical protein